MALKNRLFIYLFICLFFRQNIISMDKRLYYLNQASICAKSVTAPSKQFEMLDLQKRLDMWIKQAQEQKQLQLSSA